MDLRFLDAAPSAEERAAVDEVLGPPASGWQGGDRGDADWNLTEAGHAWRSRRDELLPALHAVNDRLGWISEGALNYICQRLTVPPAEAYGVATFYSLFSLRPAPPRVVHVCTDVVCRAAGAPDVCEALTEVAKAAVTVIKQMIEQYDGLLTREQMELEYFVPFDRGREALAAMRELMLARLPTSVFPMEVRTVGAEAAWLSHSHERETVVISVSGTPGTDYWPYLREVDALLGDFDARVHWGKLHFLTRDQMLARYPRAADFLAPVAAYEDLEGRFEALTTLLEIDALEDGDEEGHSLQ